MAKGKASKPVPFGDDPERVVKRLNKWRESYNPLRGLTMSRAVGLMESYTRGDFTDLMWVYRSAEQADETLFALVERRVSALEEMDWTVKLVTDQTPGFDPGLAEEQRAALWGRYQAMPNLYACLAHLALGVFRGFSILGKVSGGLEVVDHWNVVRDGLRRRWKYNPEAASVTYDGLPETSALDLADLVVMEAPRGHVDRLGLVKYLRSALGMKDWTAFIEIYAVPSGIVIMPNSIPAGQETAYISAAEKAAAGMPAALPAGSDYKANDAPRGVDPFSRFLDRLDQQIVLAGTGGLLTMLTQAGSGTLAGGAHSDAFKQIAKGHARRISEALQRQFDLQVLQEAFPGKPVLAYFTLEFTVESDTTQVVDHAVKLAAAGWRMDTAELSEQTGYTLVDAPVGGGASQTPDGNPNWDGLDIEEDEAEEAATRREVEAIRNRLVAIRGLVTNGRPDQERDSLGKWVDENGGGLSDDDNIKRGTKAIDRALRHRVDVRKAMYRKEVGQLDFIWGRPGTQKADATGRTHADGYGLSHIISKHGESVVKNLPVLLGKGRITPHPDSDEKRLVEHDDGVASLVRKNSRSAWVLTSYDRRQVGR